MISTYRAILLAGAILASCSLASPAFAAQGCAQPRSGFGGFLKGVTDRVGRRIGGTGIIGDVAIESRKLLSDVVACALTGAERAQAEKAQRDALSGGKTGKASRKTWTSGERGGVAGGTEVVSRSTVDGQSCAIQRTFITDVDGEEKSVEREMCQQTSGSWTT